jgi:hypothetical protein
MVQAKALAVLLRLGWVRVVRGKEQQWQRWWQLLQRCLQEREMQFCQVMRSRLQWGIMVLLLLLLVLVLAAIAVVVVTVAVTPRHPCHL